MKRRPFFSWLLGAAALLLVTSHARAFSLMVTPIPIVITGGATSTMIELRNQGSEALRVQANPFDWTQSPTGDDKLAPSAELLVFPSMVTLNPGEVRKVRVATQGGYGPTEKPFRLIFAEIPSNVSPADGQAGTVKVIANVSVPLFVKPPGAIGTPKVEAVAATKDRIRFDVRNVGNAHAMVEKVRLELTGDGGKPISNDEVAGWYILPGQTRHFDVEIGKNLNCAGAKKLVVTAISRESGQATATVDQPACAR